jgi:3-oxoacyl-[acyl-carrier protein] reductase
MNGRRLALVTGGSSGIGLAAAKLLAEDHDIAIAYAKNRERADAARKEIAESWPASVWTFEGVLRSHEDASALMKRVVETCGRGPDVLVNSIGGIGGQLFLDSDFGRHQQLINEHLTVTMSICHLSLSKMYKQRFGRIVNIGSISGRFPGRGQCSYAAAKAGVEGFTRALALEVAHRGVTVNVVAPGLVETPLTEKFIELVKSRNKDLSRGIPAGGPAKPEDVAGLVRFLCSNESHYITGSVYTVDGGRSIGNPFI